MIEILASSLITSPDRKRLDLLLEPGWKKPSSQIDPPRPPADRRLCAPGRTLNGCWSIPETVRSAPPAADALAPIAAIEGITGAPETGRSFIS